MGDPAPPTRVPCPTEPAVSIVIPVYGKWAFTAACLRSLVEAEGRDGQGGENRAGLAVDRGARSNDLEFVGDGVAGVGVEGVFNF